MQVKQQTYFLHQQLVRNFSDQNSIISIAGCTVLFIVLVTVYRSTIRELTCFAKILSDFSISFPSSHCKWSKVAMTYSLYPSYSVQGFPVRYLEATKEKRNCQWIKASINSAIGFKIVKMKKENINIKNTLI